MTDITWILELIIVVIGIIVTRYLVPWIKEKILEANNNELNFWLDFAVKAAEEKYKNVEHAGGIKFEYVLDFLQQRGFTYNEEELSVLIDGKVRELFNTYDYPSNTEVIDNE